MTFTELYQAYLKVLWDCFQFDIGVFSTPWVYACLVPIMFYLMFFVLKWMVLTLPIWLPISMALQPVRYITMLILRRKKK